MVDGKLAEDILFEGSQVPMSDQQPMWKQLMANLQRGDEIVISKFSNAARGLSLYHCSAYR